MTQIDTERTTGSWVQGLGFGETEEGAKDYSDRMYRMLKIPVCVPAGDRGNENNCLFRRLNSQPFGLCQPNTR